MGNGMATNAVDRPAPEFAVKDCALVVIATGRRAINARELRDILQDVHPGCLYQHFWGALLHSRFVSREYHNDFAAWAHHALHDNHLAERLAALDPTDYTDLEGLRRALIDVIEERLDEQDYVPWAKPDQQFSFMRSQVIVFDTRRRIERPDQLATAAAEMSPSSIFYHFIEARRRTPNSRDDFRTWLEGFGQRYEDLCREIANVDPYFQSLPELRERLALLFRNYFESVAS